MRNLILFFAFSIVFSFSLPENAKAGASGNCAFHLPPSNCIVLNTITNGSVSNSLEASSGTTPACTYPSNLPPNACARILICHKVGIDECMIQSGSGRMPASSTIGNIRCGVNGKLPGLQINGNGIADQCVRK